MEGCTDEEESWGKLDWEVVSDNELIEEAKEEADSSDEEDAEEPSPALEEIEEVPGGKPDAENTLDELSLETKSVVD